MQFRVLLSLALCAGCLPFAWAEPAAPAEARTKTEPVVTAVPEATPLPVPIEPNNGSLRLVGRWDTSDPTGPRCAWPGSSVTVHFTGTALNAKIRGSKNNRWLAIIDGKPGEAFSLQAQSGLYSLAKDLPPGEHSVRVSKITEAFFGNDQWLGFQLSTGGKLLPVTPPPHRIEIIGDSISAGYGVEGANEKEHFSPTTENNTLTYGAITARKFDADFVCIAWSGKLMWPKNTIPELYDRTLPQDPKSTWDFSRWKPEVALINLCTNDFAQGNPEEEGWVKAYTEFLARVRQNYPDCTIYCAVGPMITDPYSKSKNALSTATRYIQSAIAARDGAGDKKVRFLAFATQGANGFGSDWHPNAKQNQIMADTLVKAIEADLGWKAVVSDESGWQPRGQ